MSETEESDDRPWVWWSDALSVRCGTLSVLAVLETIAASAFGIYLWFLVGLYPLLLTSAVMAFLTMLRSEASIEKGARWFKAYEDINFISEVPKWLARTSLVAAVMVACGSLYVLVAFWLHHFTGWSFAWRLAVAIFLAWNLGAAILASAIGFSAVLDWLEEKAPFFRRIDDLYYFIAFGYGLFLGTLIRAFAVRISATTPHIKAGIFEFPTNWGALITTLDLKSAPELVPDLSKTSSFHLSDLIDEIADSDH